MHHDFQLSEIVETMGMPSGSKKPDETQISAPVCKTLSRAHWSCPMD